MDGGTEGDEALAWLDNSIWRHRKFGPKPADARDYVDHQATMRAAFKSDWEETSGFKVLRHADPDGDPPRAFGYAGMPKAVILDIQKELERWFPLLYRIFTYYSVIGADITNNVNGMPAPGYNLLIADARLDVDGNYADGRKSRFARPRSGDGWDLIWVAINSSPESAGGSATRFTRSEFLQWIVRGSIAGNPEEEEMATCVRRFCEDLVGFLSEADGGSEILADPNVFRREHCYIRETEAMLRHHDETLRNVFKVYAEKGAGGIEVDGSTEMLSAAQWMALMNHIGIVKEVGVRNLYLIFAQSRMAVIQMTNPKANQQLTQLTYESYLEAMVRLSLLKALPTDKELKKKCFSYPGEYIGAILNRGVSMLEAWIVTSKKAQAMGKADPSFRRVDMMILVIVSVMQFGVEVQPGGPSILLRGHPDEILSLEEVTRYWKKPTPSVFEEMT